MRIVCQQTILIKYHALFIKSGKIWNCRLMQIIGGALLVKFGGFIICRKITCSIVHVQYACQVVPDMITTYPCCVRAAPQMSSAHTLHFQAI